MTSITKLSQLDLNGTYSYADYLTWKFDERLELIRGHKTAKYQLAAMYSEDDIATPHLIP
ncbi:MAG: hypothetical protein PHP00_11370 [Thiotrichaceae bacterium]|nr:hypothetical protein [Thiotrichaceae bacterium]